MAGWFFSVFAFGLALLIAPKLWSLFHHYILMPRAVRACFLRQGIRGPPALPIVGNMLEILDLRAKARENDFSEITHDILDHVLPDFNFYARQYGKMHLTWMADEPRLIINDPDLMREVLCKKSGHFIKTPMVQKTIEDLVGNGLILSNGEEWAQSRRIVSPAFHAEKLKAMTGTMTRCALEMVHKWEMIIEEQGSEAEIEVLEQFISLTGDVISHTAFGSSYEKGKKVFELMHSLQLVLPTANRMKWLPGSRLIPTSINLQVRSLRKELQCTLDGLVEERKILAARNGEYGNDLLGIMLTEATVGEKSHGKFGNDKVIEECKTFYLAGHETTSTLLTWTLMLLAKYPIWQHLCRNEAQEICKADLPDAEMLGKLKVVTMVINESLRLYPPALFMVRGADQNMDLGKVSIPKGVAVVLPILAIHHDPSLWGADVNEFNPNRFAKGIADACKHPMAFIPFSAGPRICVGQAFALLEAKIVLVFILSRFKFHLSPSYIHNPASILTMRPLHGMPLIIQRL